MIICIASCCHALEGVHCRWEQGVGRLQGVRWVSRVLCQSLSVSNGCLRSKRLLHASRTGMLEWLWSAWHTCARTVENFKSLAVWSGMWGSCDSSKPPCGSLVVTSADLFKVAKSLGFMLTLQDAKGSSICMLLCTHPSYLCCADMPQVLWIENIKCV